MTRFDGRLLWVCLCLTASPCAAATLTVGAGGDLQAAIDAARPGDTILLQAGATFTGSFKLPVKGGTSFITIRSSASDAELPPAGTRISPAHASLLPKIRATTAGPAIRTVAGTSYWRFMFIEFRPSSSSSAVNLVEFGSVGSEQSTLSDVPHHFVIDRCYLHGDPGYGQRRGLALNSGDTQVLNSYFADFKKVTQDTQAIMGWNGPGPYLIENNYIEAAAENIMFGGNDPNIPQLVPSNITIRRNLISKPLAWRTQSWTIKNLMEFKNAQNVRVEGNVIEHNWSAGQQGYSIVFSPRNQGGTAPWSVVRDIVIQNNVIRHVAAVFNISGYDDLATSRQTANITIRNNLVYDVNTSYGSSTGAAAPARFAIIGNGPTDITIDHNTIDNNGSSTIFIYAGHAPTGTKIYDFALTNNLLRDNQYGVFGDKFGEGTLAFNNYTPNAVVLRNAFGGASPKTYPTGNDFPTLSAWLADFVNAAAGDYRLDASALSKSAGTDGKDIGVNFAELDTAMKDAAPLPSPPPTPPPAPTGSTPYGGTAATLPGTVQCENYDAGGSMVAYYDTTSGNAGGSYRSNNVDIQPTTDTGGGYTIGWVKATEWLNYSLNVVTSGTYTLDVRVASNGTGGAFHVEVNGVNRSGRMTVPNTGGWQTWQTISVGGLALAAGPQVFKVVMESNGPGGSVGNFNWMRVR